jgi:F420-dependent oxidoreductase-like protein
MLEAYTLLGALAASTSRAMLGTLVTGVTYRNPALLAKIITTLDVISQGRAILGIGAAWHDVEHDGYGFDFPAVGERMDRLEEALQICRAMFRQDKATFAGRHYRISEARNIPRPIQPNGPRIMVGGGGEKRTLRLVAQYADACNVTGDPEMIRHKIDVIQRHCKDVGRDPSEIAITRMATLVITDSPQATADTRSFVTAAAGEEAARTFNIGQEDEVLAQLKELTSAGVDEFIFNMPLSDAAGVGAAGRMLTGAFG